MNLWTPLTILIGRKDAIEDVLESKNAIYVGLLFVISCGFAREYDQEYIFSDFLFFLLPLILSTILGFFCFCFCYIVYIKKDGRKNFWQQFRNFLSLFWMTAPIAFLYAIPVESLMDSLTATKINMLLLATVATWRVLLFAYIIKKVLDIPFWIILNHSVFFASLILFPSSFFKKISLVNVMGGTLNSPEEHFILAVSSAVNNISFFLVIITFLISILTPSLINRGGQNFIRLKQRSEKKGLLVVAGLILFSFMIISIPSQKQLKELHHYQKLLSEKDYKNALLFASQFPSKDDFIDNRPLPPYGHHGNWMLGEIIYILDGEEAHWVRQELIQNMTTMLKQNHADLTWSIGAFDHDFWDKFLSQPWGKKWLTQNKDFYEGHIEPLIEKKKNDAQ